MQSQSLTGRGIVPTAILIVLISALIITQSALTLGVAPAAATGIFELFKFLQDMLTGSVALGILVAILVNIFKPYIPDGYADTAALMTTILLCVIGMVLKLFLPDLTIAGLDAFFQRLVDSQALWVPVVIWLIHFLSGQAHQVLRGIPVIGRSYEKPAIFSRHSYTYQ